MYNNNNNNDNNNLKYNDHFLQKKGSSYLYMLMEGVFSEGAGYMSFRIENNQLT